MLSQVLLAPPYVYAVLPAMFQAAMADRVKNCRAWMMLLGCAQSIIGTMLYSHLPESYKAGRYVGTFLAVGGCNANVGIILSWSQCSIRQQSKRGAWFQEERVRWRKKSTGNSPNLRK